MRPGMRPQPNDPSPMKKDKMESPPPSGFTGTGTPLLSFMGSKPTGAPPMKGPGPNGQRGGKKF